MATDMTPDDADTARDWESLQVNDAGDDKTARLRVAGGWLYRNIVIVGTALALGLVFVRADDLDDEADDDESDDDGKG